MVHLTIINILILILSEQMLFELIMKQSYFNSI